MSEHPSDETIVGWLETGRPSRVERHLEGCAACLERVDALSDLDATVRSELATVTAPPDDLAPRTTDRVRLRLGAQEAVSTLVELFTLPWRTLDALVDEDALARRVVPSAAAGDDDAEDDRGAT
ncbi:anti-sigma factor family protein [Actinomarinicola tropica]|uniref:Zinc-finger domain-containing protein n=1 Tax=Actinomarinicola tropica TaxID=2789776 RepID=A0A5Q2RLM8_9ACTN|nr:hypothetical protein [Actinomarinicola tropica]QGG96384.1 hypothetical protein GH723_15470 [Actinomarinicola tropica]